MDTIIAPVLPIAAPAIGVFDIGRGRRPCDIHGASNASAAGRRGMRWAVTACFASTSTSPISTARSPSTGCSGSSRCSAWRSIRRPPRDRPGFRRGAERRRIRPRPHRRRPARALPRSRPVEDAADRGPALYEIEQRRTLPHPRACRGSGCDPRRACRPGLHADERADPRGTGRRPAADDDVLRARSRRHGDRGRIRPGSSGRLSRCGK